ncbi:hypothetical protein [Actinomadura hibisca]|uniref:hypothetical protein n=1 Tax=Actinomadura hibisca TaxID=68565 RepID=UPI0012F94465|nr:hypothetical protein [Actinomadura hibisca]
MTKNMQNKGRKAWLITWEWVGDHAKVPSNEIIAAILKPQTGADAVRRFVEVLYAAREYDPIDMLQSLTHNPYPASFMKIGVEVEGVGVRYPNYEGEIQCGHNPYLRARLVNNLKLRDEDNPQAGLIWGERPLPKIS